MELDSALAQLSGEPNPPLDLAELALWLARDEYPDVDIEAYLSELSGIAHEAKSYMRGRLECRVSGLCRYLFHDMGFHGNTHEYYDPLNSYLNLVLDRRTGIPITLSLVAMAVGSRAGLHMEGIGLPGHFVVKACEDQREVVFDPFHGGRQLTLTDCENLVHQATGMSFQATVQHLAGASLRAIVIRMLTNLKAIYMRQEDFCRAARVIGRLQQVNPEDVEQRRDLGLCLLQAGHPGQAIDHLSAYLAVCPDSCDAESTQQWLNQAWKDVGTWN
jgi:regulator of sirC expression with transglutaminase-like and TPR domain